MNQIKDDKKLNSQRIGIEHGITLIALIITIILMLILGTVVVTGAINGELLGYAKRTKDNTEIFSEREGIEKSYITVQGVSEDGTVSEIEFQKALNKVMGENQAEVMVNGKKFVVKIGKRYYEIDKKGKISDPIECAEDKTLAECIVEINKRRLAEGWDISETIPTGWESEKVIAITDGTNTVPLPNEYSVSQEEGEHTVETGLVITDENENEFVWIPVTNDLINPYRYNTLRNEPVELDKNWDSANALQSRYGLNYFNYTNDFKCLEEYAEMVASVNKYHGFYIGRYETTIDEKGNIGSVYNTPILTANQSVVIKKGKTAQTCKWYGLYYLQKTTDYIIGNGSIVQTAMISGQLWDKTMNYIKTQKTAENTIYNVDSSTSSWHQGAGVVNSAQANLGDVALNIYDLEANAYEWTQETFSSRNRTLRRRQLQY